MKTLYRLLVVCGFAMLCYNMFNFYCPRLAASYPVSSYIIVLLSAFVSKKILQLIPSVFEPSFAKPPQPVSQRILQ